MTTRRSPLEGIRPEALGYRPAERERTTRDRSWDRAQRADPDSCQISVRGVPRRVYRRMGEIARERGLTVSQVAANFLEYALQAYEARCEECDDGAGDA